MPWHVSMQQFSGIWQEGKMSFIEGFQQFLREAPKGSPLSGEQTDRFYTLGFSLYNAGSFEEALQVFRVLCVQNPWEYRHWFGFASTLQESKEYEKALYAWSMAAVIDQTVPQPHFHAAECAFSLSKSDEAIAALDEALARAEDYPILQDQIALLKTTWSTS